MNDRAKIEAAQWEALCALLGEISPGNRFYARKLGALKIQSLSDFSRLVPFTFKSELVDDQRAHPPYGTNLSFPLERYTRFNQTSATTGNPLRWLDTPQSWSALLDCWDEVFDAANVAHEARLFFAFSFGPFLGFWTAFESAARRGNLCIPGGGLSTEGRLRAVWDNAASVLCCTPTYALRLGEAARRAGLENSPVRHIIVAGEPGGSIPGVRAAIEKLWAGARVFDHHGMTEVGPVTYECPQKTGVLHVIESAYFAEVIKPDGAPAKEGEVGELVLTTLRRTASPLLRYRTGDLVKRGPMPCVCGRSEMALDGGILGRADDMIIVRGVNVFPGAIEEIVRRFPEVVEYRVEVDSRGTLPELRLQIEAPLGTARCLEEALRASLSLRVPVQCVPENSLPRFEMKAKRWVRI
jgi:phenylacetate-CoA ligase